VILMKAVVLSSGGLDLTACLATAKKSCARINNAAEILKISNSTFSNFGA